MRGNSQSGLGDGGFVARKAGEKEGGDGESTEAQTALSAQSTRACHDVNGTSGPRTASQQALSESPPGPTAAGPLISAPNKHELTGVSQSGPGVPQKKHILRALWRCSLVWLHCRPHWRAWILARIRLLVAWGCQQPCSFFQFSRMSFPLCQETYEESGGERMQLEKLLNGG